ICDSNIKKLNLRNVETIYMDATDYDIPQNATVF
ncbi:unnamed protein product, partial [marine sediment metagenome]